MIAYVSVSRVRQHGRLPYSWLWLFYLTETLATKSLTRNYIVNSNIFVSYFTAIMATAFVVGDKFRDKVTQLLEQTDAALPPRLRDELKEILDLAEPTTLSFGTARKLKQYLQEEGKESRYRVS